MLHHLFQKCQVAAKKLYGTLMQLWHGYKVIFIGSLLIFLLIHLESKEKSAHQPGDNKKSAHQPKAR